MYNSTSIGKRSRLHQHKSMYHKMRYKNYVPHVPQIEVQFEVQSRVHGGKINTKNLTAKVYENLKNF